MVPAKGIVGRDVSLSASEVKEGLGLGLGLGLGISVKEVTGCNPFHM